MYRLFSNNGKFYSILYHYLGLGEETLPLHQILFWHLLAYKSYVARQRHHHTHSLQLWFLINGSMVQKPGLIFLESPHHERIISIEHVQP